MLRRRFVRVPVFGLLLVAICGQVVRPETVPYETQSAQCTITAGDVQASAQATISKRLDGVSGSVQLARSFELLELRLMQELAEIRRFLLATNTDPNVQPLLQHGPPNVGNYMQLVPPDSSSPTPTQPADPSPTPLPLSIATINSTTPQTPTLSNSILTSPEPTSPPPLATTLAPASTSTQASSPNPTRSESRTIHFQPVQLKSLHPNTSGANSGATKKRRTRPRELEVARFNNTLLRGDEIRIFSYYWRIEDFRGKLLARNVSQIESPTFSISGLHLRVLAVLNHLNRDYLYLQLQTVPHRRRDPVALGEDVDDADDDSDVVLQSGSMFREIETREYFRHKIVILDQETPTKDLVSQEFFNTRSGFQVPNSAIVAGPYAKDSTILVKVVIYL